MNKLSMSTGPLPVIIGEDYYDLDGIIRAMQKLWKTGAVDGFEFQNQAEWVAEAPPRERAERRGPRWEVSTKYTWEEVAAMLQKANLPISLQWMVVQHLLLRHLKWMKDREFGLRIEGNSIVQR